MTVLAGIGEQVLAIADDFFTAMITGESGSVRLHDDEVVLVDPVFAWVDVAGAFSARALLSTERTTADALARALFAMPPEEEVSDADLTDAFGEIANVVGGNIKSLLPESGVLTMPQVAVRAPEPAGDLIHRTALDWAGRGLAIDIWKLDNEGGVA